MPSYAERYFHHRFCFTVIVEQNFYQLYFVTGIDFVCFGKAGVFFATCAKHRQFSWGKRPEKTSIKSYKFAKLRKIYKRNASCYLVRMRCCIPTVTGCGYSIRHS